MQGHVRMKHEANKQTNKQTQTVDGMHLRGGVPDGKLSARVITILAGFTLARRPVRRLSSSDQEMQLLPRNCERALLITCLAVGDASRRPFSAFRTWRPSSPKTAASSRHWLGQLAVLRAQWRKQLVADPSHTQGGDSRL